MPRRPTRWDAQAALWAARSVWSVRRQLRTQRLDELHLRPPPRRPTRGAVRIVLRLCRCSCLEQALLMQAWFAGHGHERSVVIGVTGPRGFAAHAWLEGDVPCPEGSFEEIARLPVR